MYILSNHIIIICFRIPPIKISLIDPIYILPVYSFLFLEFLYHII